jgi:hypothetical protein
VTGSGRQWQWQAVAVWQSDSGSDTGSVAVWQCTSGTGSNSDTGSAAATVAV